MCENVHFPTASLTSAAPSPPTVTFCSLTARPLLVLFAWSNLPLPHFPSQLHASDLSLGIRLGSFLGVFSMGYLAPSPSPCYFHVSCTHDLFFLDHICVPVPYWLAVIKYGLTHEWKKMSREIILLISGN